MLCRANLSKCVLKLDDSLQRVALCENQNLRRVRHKLLSQTSIAQNYLCRVRHKLLRTKLSVLNVSSDSAESDKFRHKLFIRVMNHFYEGYPWSEMQFSRKNSSFYWEPLGVISPCSKAILQASGPLQPKLKIKWQI